MPQPLIIVGVATRAAADSARAAGFDPWCVELRGDVDAREAGPVKVCPPEEYPAGVLRRMNDAPRGAPLLLTGEMENHPDVVRAMGFAHKVLGTAPEAVERVRDPLALASLPTAPGLKFCKTRTKLGLTSRVAGMMFGMMSRRKWLLKPRRGWRGRGIRWWRPGQPIGRGQYIQEYVRGTSYSAVFRGDGWSATLVGVTEQLVGEEAFGAGEFVYCGSIGAAHLSEKARAAMSHLAVQLTQKFDVRGVFEVDLVQDWRGNHWPVEVNPRYPKSAEVLERALGVAVLGKAKEQRKRELATGANQVGKAIVYARREVVMPELRTMLTRDRIADEPEAGRKIGAGEMICTVFGEGATRDLCCESLREMAGKVYAAVEG